MAIGCSDEDILRDNTITEPVLEALWTVVVMTFSRASPKCRCGPSRLAFFPLWFPLPRLLSCPFEYPLVASRRPSQSAHHCSHLTRVLQLSACQPAEPGSQRLKTPSASRSTWQTHTYHPYTSSTPLTGRERSKVHAI